MADFLKFSAADLSVIAQRLDAMEERYDNDNMGTESTNMDDTGKCCRVRT
jgi:Ataxin-3